MTNTVVLNSPVEYPVLSDELMAVLNKIEVGILTLVPDT